MYSFSWQPYPQVTHILITNWNLQLFFFTWDPLTEPSSILVCVYFIFGWRHQILYFPHQVPYFQPNHALQMNIWLTWFDDPPMTRNGVGKNRDTSSAFKVACWEINVYKFNPRAARSVHSECHSTLLSPDFLWTSFPWSSSELEPGVIQWSFEPSWKASVGEAKGK